MTRKDRRRHPAVDIAWHLCALALVMVAPSYVWRGLPVWRLPADELALPLTSGAAYLLLALLAGASARTRSPARLLSVVAAGLVCFAAAAGALLLRPDLPVSWGIAGLGCALGVAFAAAPWWLERSFAPMLGLMFVGLLTIVGAGGLAADTRAARCGSQVIATALHALSVECFDDLVAKPLESDGGAIAALGDGFIVVTGTGRFYRLHWSQVDRRLHSEAMALTAPLDRKLFLAQQPDPQVTPRRRRLRVTGLLVDASVEPARVLVAHQYWHGVDKCFTMRVSAISLPAKPGVADPDARWQTLYDSRPCLAEAAAFDDIETGGRLAFGPDRQLFLTLGDHGFDGRAGADALAQDGTGDYGKILSLDGRGGREIFTRGHRNPQGLALRRDGSLWSTEHGPQGGDEINVIVAGANYGWPLVSYGTDYGLQYWPLSPESLDHGRFVEPAHVFSPSVGISNLLEISSSQFPRWNGDLLVASLRLQTLYRIRTRGDRVTYVEPITLRHRIRDLAQGSDGRIVLWTDEGDLLSIAAATRVPTGAALYRSCSGCHEAGAIGTVRSGPDLLGIVGRKVGSASDFAYSAAFKRLDGVWTKDRLDAFLSDPAAFAPGTAMKGGAVANAVERAKLIDYLAGRK